MHATLKCDATLCSEHHHIIQLANKPTSTMTSNITNATITFMDDDDDNAMMGWEEEEGSRIEIAGGRV